jgi:homoserine kinase
VWTFRPLPARWDSCDEVRAVNWPEQPVTVRVPATSANLGPGFDSLGLALSLYDHVHARVIPAGVDVQVTGEGADQVGRGEQHLVIRAMRAGFAAMGTQPPGIGLACRNEVPQGFGLGSSAAAIVAGLIAARALAAGCDQRGEASGSGLSDDGLLRLACELEGHPDNVAACLRGGLTIAWNAGNGAQVARLEPAPGLVPVLCVPAEPLATETARKVLPSQIPHSDAAANSARTALLIAALNGRHDLLLAGTQDFLHQSYRSSAMPATADLIAQLRSTEIAAVVSGAGPAVLALTTESRPRAISDVSRIARDTGVAWRVLPLTIDLDGASVLPG